jgi:hypothetical protein
MDWLSQALGSTRLSCNRRSTTARWPFFAGDHESPNCLRALGSTRLSCNKRSTTTRWPLSRGPTHRVIVIGARIDTLVLQQALDHGEMALLRRPNSKRDSLSASTRIDTLVLQQTLDHGDDDRFLHARTESRKLSCGTRIDTLVLQQALHHGEMTVLRRRQRIAKLSSSTRIDTLRPATNARPQRDGRSAQALEISPR